LRAVIADQTRLLVENDGTGIPAARREGSLGLRLIEMFAIEVKGRAVMEAGRGGQCTIVVVTVPNPNNLSG
jgi:two-component sensor histidine kinase